MSDFHADLKAIGVDAEDLSKFSVENLSTLFPRELDDFSDLFAAVAHGCAAGLHNDAFATVYNPRIRRLDANYLGNKLGGWSASIRLLREFCDRSRPVPGLSQQQSSVVLADLVQAYQIVGRTEEAYTLGTESLQLAVNKKQWENVSRWASIMCELNLVVGDVGAAVAAAKQGMQTRDERGMKTDFAAVKFALAHALHLAGDVTQAEELFGTVMFVILSTDDENDDIHKWLHSYRAAELLLTLGEFQRAAGLAQGVIDNEVVTLRMPKVTSALNRLICGWALTRLASIEGRRLGNGQGEAPESEDAMKRVARRFQAGVGRINEAIERLRNCEAEDCLPRGLILRATLLREVNKCEEAERDLREALQIAERGDMQLHVVDAKLELARQMISRFILKFEGKTSDWAEAAGKYYEEAKDLINRTGYNRRIPELVAIQQCLLGRRPYDHDDVGPDLDSQGQPAGAWLKSIQR